MSVALYLETGFLAKEGGGGFKIVAKEYSALQSRAPYLRVFAWI